MTSSRTSRRTSPRRSALAVGGVLLALSGCSLHPGEAAVVGSESITQARVDELAEAICVANVAGAVAQGQPPPELPSRGARQLAVQVLLDTTLSEQFGEETGVEPDQERVSEALAQNEQAVELLPEEQQEPLREALRRDVEAQLTVMAAGRRSLQRQGETDVSDQQALAEGQRLRSEFVADLDVEVDPRYGTFRRGALQPGVSSLSVPVSEQAVTGALSEPGEAWVADLPASQKCG